MRKTFKILFVIVLLSYLAALATLSYVSVYYSYFAIPALAILGTFAFGKIDSIHDTSLMIFWGTLILTLITLFTVTYVGVYLAPISITILLISGFSAYLTREKNTI